MFSGDQATLCKLTSAKEQMKRNIQPILEPFRAFYNDEEGGRIAVRMQPHIFLRSRCDQIRQKLGYDAMISKASWNPAMISSKAKASPWVDSAGKYDVLLVRKADVVVIVDLLCCMFLSCDFHVDLCFLDVYQIRSILAPSTWIYPYNKMQESKQVLIEGLLRNKAFREVVNASLDCREVNDVKTKNRLNHRAELIGICSAATAFVVANWGGTLSADYFVTDLKGEWNPVALTDEYNKNWKGTAHNWLRIRSKATLVTVEFDHTFMQFLGTPHDATLASYFLDVGQMRSVGLTLEEINAGIDR